MGEGAKAGKGGSHRVCIVTYPFALSKVTKVYNLLFDLLEIFESVTDKLYVITGNIPADEIPDNRKYHLINFEMEKELRRHLPMYVAFPIWLFNYIIGQVKMSYNLLKISKNIDIVIFFLGYEYLLPILTAKILGKRTVMIVTISSKSAKMAYNKVFYYISRIIERISYSLSDQLVVDPQNVSMLGLQRYENKIAYGPRHVNLDSFKIIKKIDERENIVGYVGRFSEEKGIRNFADAIPLIFKECENVKFLMGGDGLLFKEIKQKLERYPSDKLIFMKWIPHENLPEYLNGLKLIVIPSYTETGPFIALEAMACGTPVLSTSVGLVSDIIKDGETGFILEDNSPECIARNVIRASEHANLGEIVKNARKTIEEKFTYIAAVERYREILYNSGVENT
ncbi:MAG: D-inositol-3-phosphate glycosyltransferase [Candidatus Argoarchaeum ethanivorans]|uniref:D-inositol-3-phosphate glycosyltransferase n=1 Tax=Candidatus Argoarchaeum ethanivorans TaxID=2608793 RepID=A0A811T692_9EURY|nr:MAG: D-inositol-3-phosphate glycosyltransferase [Candidatus Argoarchaeum ethanivorans]